MQYDEQYSIVNNTLQIYDILQSQHWRFTMDQDAEHLNLLSIFYYILGSLTIVASVVLLVKVALLIVMGSVFRQVTMSPSSQGEMDPLPYLGDGMIVFAFVFGLLALLVTVLGICQIVTGTKLKACKSRSFCQAIAGITCISFPIGTVLGIFTFTVMNRPSVMAMFEPNRKVNGMGVQ